MRELPRCYIGAVFFWRMKRKVDLGRVFVVKWRHLVGGDKKVRTLIIVLVAFAAMVILASCPKGNIRIDDSSSSTSAVSTSHSGGVLNVDLDTAPMQLCSWSDLRVDAMHQIDTDLTIPLRGKSVIRAKHKLTINEKEARGYYAFMLEYMSLNALKRNANGNWMSIASNSAKDVSTEDYFIIEFNVPPGADLLLLYPGEENVLLIKP